MCNRYGHWASVSQLRKLAQDMDFGLITTPETDNLPVRGDIYPDQDAPILVPSTDGLTLNNARWGLPPFTERDAKGRRNTPRNNIRQVGYWLNAPLDDMIAPISRRDIMIKPEHRCLVPFSAFAEPAHKSTWFNVPDRKVACFAGVWMHWKGERLKPEPGKKKRTRQPGDWLLYSLLTTEANEIVKPIHPDAMPVILTDPEDCREWLAGGEASLRLQRPLPDHKLQITTPPV